MILANGRWAQGEHKRDGGLRVAFFAPFPLLLPIFAPLGSVDVIGVHLLVFLFLLLGQFLPVETLLGREGLPLLTDCFGQICLALLLCWAVERCSFLECCLTVFAAFSAEEDERVLGALDIIFVALLGSALDVAAYRRLAPFVRR